MVSHGTIDTRDVDLKHGRLVRAGVASSSGLELVRGSSVVDASKGFRVRTEGVGGFGGSDGEQVATDEGEVGEKFANFGVGGDEVEESTEVLGG